MGVHGAPGSPRRRAPALAALALGTAVVGVLSAEGALSLFWGRSLRGLVGGGLAPPAPVRPLRDEELARAAAQNPGPYMAHPDPRVGYVFRPDAELRILGVPFHTNGLGLRRRPGPPPRAGALRVVVLGDSVAFGIGVRDEETLACQLERFLGGPARAAVWTVAVPGWNARNAVACLLDHWPVYRPDLVVYVPVGNDLDDTDSVHAAGHRRFAPDPLMPEPLLRVSGVLKQEALGGLVRRLRRRGRNPAAVAPGVPALAAGLGPEGKHRYRQNALALLRLERCLKRRGGHLLLLPWEREQYVWLLLAELQRLGGTGAVAPSWPQVPRWMRLPEDPHPTAETLQVLARVAAGELVRRGWATPPPLPAVPPRYAALLKPPPTPAVVARRAAAIQAEARQRLRACVDFTTGTGAFQIYGVWNPDGSAGPRLAMVLRRGGPHLRVELKPLAGCTRLYPLEVTVFWNRRPCGRLRLGGSGPGVGLFALPGEERLGEVLLAVEDWTVIHRRGRRWLAAYYPVRVACE